MVYKPDNIDSSPRALTQAVLQITDMLAMYQAELASVLQLKCSDIGRMVNARQLLAPHSRAWEQALLFVRFYELLFDMQAGNGVAMRNWLRRKHPVFAESPLVLMVDKKQLLQLVKELEELH